MPGIFKPDVDAFMRRLDTAPPIKDSDLGSLGHVIGAVTLIGQGDVEGFQTKMTEASGHPSAGDELGFITFNSSGEIVIP